MASMVSPAALLMVATLVMEAHCIAPRMKVDGEGVVRDPNGHAFLAKGVNWGKRSMSEKTGATIYNASDAIIAKQLFPGLNHVRVVLDYYDPSGACQTDIFEAGSPDTGYIKPQWLAFIDNSVQWTRDAGVWVTLTMRNNYGTASPHGESTNDVPCDADYIGNATARALWFKTWQFLAKRYTNATNIAWWEPASEVLACTVMNMPCRTHREQHIDRHASTSNRPKKEPNVSPSIHLLFGGFELRFAPCSQPHLTHGTKATNFAPCHTPTEVTNIAVGERQRREGSKQCWPTEGAKGG